MRRDCGGFRINSGEPMQRGCAMLTSDGPIRIVRIVRIEILRAEQASADDLRRFLVHAWHSRDRGCPRRADRQGSDHAGHHRQGPVRKDPRWP